MTISAIRVFERLQVEELWRQTQRNPALVIGVTAPTALDHRESQS
jgi:hypothetical protein